MDKLIFRLGNLLFYGSSVQFANRRCRRRSSSRMDLNNTFHAIFRCLSLFSNTTEERFNRLDYFLFTCHFGGVIGSIVAQYFYFDKIYAFEGNAVLMVLDFIQITGPIVGHGIIILEAFFLRKYDVNIMKMINGMDKKLFTSYKERLVLFRRMLVITGYHAFFMVTVAVVVPIIICIRVFPDKQERSWGVGIVYKVWSVLVTKLYICLVAYYFTYIASRLQKIHDILEDRKLEINGNLLKEAKDNVNILWRLQELLVKRFAVTLVLMIGLHFCYAIIGIFFLIRRLKLKKFKFMMDSVLLMLPDVFTFLTLLQANKVVYVMVGFFVFWFIFF